MNNFQKVTLKFAFQGAGVVEHQVNLYLQYWNPIEKLVPILDLDGASGSQLCLAQHSQPSLSPSLFHTGTLSRCNSAFQVNKYIFIKYK